MSDKMRIGGEPIKDIEFDTDKRRSRIELGNKNAKKIALKP
jgi:hypothetical protein